VALRCTATNVAMRLDINHRKCPRMDEASGDTLNL
jgi:hypothetical protein